MYTNAYTYVLNGVLQALRWKYMCICGYNWDATVNMMTVAMTMWYIDGNGGNGGTGFELNETEKKGRE